jgi:type VI secretion system protein ImpK
VTTDDPFNNDDSDRTVIKPMPGGRGPGAIPSSTPPPIAPAPVTPGSAAAPPAAAQAAFAIRGSGLNPLVNAATSLLALVGQLRGTPTHPDVAGLRNHVAQEVKSFEDKARTQGVAPEMILAARYTLCTLLDETVLCTPWGSESAWSKQSLLSTFHNETWGGEKFFLILERMSQEPASNLHILELMFISMSLGFEGKYRVLEQGGAKLAEIQDNLFRTIRMQRGDFERELSPHWHGVEDKRNALVRYVPLWVVGALAGAMLLTIYAGFGYILKSSADPVQRQLETIAQQVVKPE